MRVVEPKLSESRNIKKSTNNNRKLLSIILLVGLSLSVIFFIYNTNIKSKSIVENEVSIIMPPDINIEESKKTGLREFSGNEFRLLYDNYLLPNTEKVGSPPYITGDDVVDARIRQLAETRGYKLRTSPSTPLSAVDAIYLQEIAQLPWKNLQLTARNEGLGMSLTSGYRSVEDQRELFLSRIQAEGISLSAISSGNADEALIKILTKAAVPGYSKHHSGYTIDIKCEGWEFENFVNSKCNDWLVANNYEKAKVYGFIPSYPIGADLQGPDPEAWEYVYIGQDVLNY